MFESPAGLTDILNWSGDMKENSTTLHFLHYSTVYHGTLHYTTLHYTSCVGVEYYFSILYFLSGVRLSEGFTSDGNGVRCHQDTTL